MLPSLLNSDRVENTASSCLFSRPFWAITGTLVAITLPGFLWLDFGVVGSVSAALAISVISGVACAVGLSAADDVQTVTARRTASELKPTPVELAMLATDVTMHGELHLAAAAIKPLLGAVAEEWRPADEQLVRLNLRTPSPASEEPVPQDGQHNKRFQRSARSGDWLVPQR